jgi:hypothetical protein
MNLRGERANQLFVAIVMALAAIGLTACTVNVLRGEELYLASSHAWPGAIWRSELGLPERDFYERPSTPLASAPGGVPRIAHVAVTADGKQFYCSGLDGYILQNLGGHDVVVCKFDGQIRDVAIGRENHTLYFSVVSTPQGGAPLADGKIYRFDRYTGRPVEIARVNQKQVGENWWGTFAIHDGLIYLATLEDSSRVFKLDGNEAIPVKENTGLRITGLAINPEGEFLFATGGTQIFRTRDFSQVHAALSTRRRVTDVALIGQGRAE